MLGNMTTDQYEQMKQQLIVPLAVSDILCHDINIEPDMQYGLHMALSEVDPDSALLAIALCAQDLAAKTMTYVPIARALQKEATDILNHYGPQWLRNNLNSPIPSSLYEEILDTVPEDLEALADLIDSLELDLDDPTSPLATLARLLSIQARAHMEIADFVLAEIAYEKQSDEEKQKNLPSFGYKASKEHSSSAAQPSFAGDNIIVFPGAQS